MDAGGEGLLWVGGVIFERRSSSCRRWLTARWSMPVDVQLNPSGGEVEALLRRGSREKAISKPAAAIGSFEPV